MQDKIFSIEAFLPILARWRPDGKVVFTNGCFDILHVGHVDYLEKAKQLGRWLVVGLNTDASVQKIKGKTRPIINQFSRSYVLSGMAAVDAVILFDDETPLKLIEALKPDILVKGNDYSVENIVGADIVIQNGGLVQTIPLVSGYSTSSIINKILNNQ